MKLIEIAAELDLSDSQIRKWKNQDKWEVQLNGNVTKSKGNVTKRKRGAPAGNANAKGHGAPFQNQNAQKHGLFSKFLPDEAKEIMDAMTELSAADLIWQQIQIQFAAIIRSQKIMWVTDKDEMIKEIKKTETYSDDDSTSEKQEWEFQFAWDRQATFLNAQSRAMGELRSLIKQFDELAHVHDERRLKLEVMQSAIATSKAELEKLTNNNDEGPIEIVIKRKGEGT